MSAGWRTVALASLAVNLLVIGGLAGGYAAGARFEPPQPASAAPERAGRGPGSMQALLSTLPPERRREVRREVAKVFVQSRDARKEARDARAALAQTALAEPYDSAAVKAAFARMRAADGALTGRFHDAIADVFAEMNPQERRQAIKQLIERRRLQGPPPPERADAPQD